MMTRGRVAHVATIDLTIRNLLMEQLVHLRDAGFEVTAISAAGPWVPEIEANGIRHLAWGSATRAWDPTADLRAMRELLTIFRRERFDLVHTHNAKPGVIGRIAARIAGIPCVVNTIHGFDARPDDRIVKRAGFMGAEWFAARFSDAELYQSRADMIRARRLRMKPSRRTFYIGNGTDLSRFDRLRIDKNRVRALRGELGIDPCQVVVGTIGRLVGDKGYREFFAAANRVRKTRPDVVFLAVGDRDPGKADAITESEIAAAGPDVVFTGWREDIPEVLSMMDVFVLPSWREGVPRSAIEAAAMGLPLVLSDIPGCREIGEGDRHCLFFPPRDPQSMADMILRVLDDDALRRRLGAAVRKRALERFDESRVAATVVAITESVLATKEGSQASAVRI